MRPNFRPVGNSNVYFTCCPRYRPAWLPCTTCFWKSTTGLPACFSRTSAGGAGSVPASWMNWFSRNFEHIHGFSVCYTVKHFFMRSPSPLDSRTVLKFQHCAAPEFKNNLCGLCQSRNRVVAPAYQATNAGGIDSLEPIPGLLKSLKIPCL